MEIIIIMTFNKDTEIYLQGRILVLLTDSLPLNHCTPSLRLQGQLDPPLNATGLAQAAMVSDGSACGSHLFS